MQHACLCVDGEEVVPLLDDCSLLLHLGKLLFFEFVFLKKLGAYLFVTYFQKVQQPRVPR